MIALSELIEIRKGKKPLAAHSTAGESFHRLLQIDDLRPGAVPRFCPAQAGETIVRRDDVVIVWDGANAGLSGHQLEGSLGSTLARIRLRNQSVEAPYLAAFLRSREGYLRRRTNGAAIPHLDGRILGELRVPVPALAEQRRIADILDRADGLRAKRRESIAQLEGLTQAIFLEMFGDPVTNPRSWQVRRFEEVMTDVTSRSPKLRASEFQTSGLYPVIDQGQADIAGYCDDASMLCVSSLPVVVFGDHTRIVRLVTRPFVIGADGAKVLSPASGLEAIFLAELLRGLKIKNLGYSRHMRELKRMSFPVPPLEMQREFARRASAVDALKAKYRASLAELDALFASLQHRAFSGAL